MGIFGFPKTVAAIRNKSGAITCAPEDTYNYQIAFMQPSLYTILGYYQTVEECQSAQNIPVGLGNVESYSFVMPSKASSNSNVSSGSNAIPKTAGTSTSNVTSFLSRYGLYIGIGIALIFIVALIGGKKK